MKNTLFLHEFYVMRQIMRPLFWLSTTIAEEAIKVLQGGVSLPFIGSLHVYSADYIAVNTWNMSGMFIVL